MATCKDCFHFDACDVLRYGDISNCNSDYCGGFFKPKTDVVKVVRCKDCIHAVEFDKHCELNRNYYKHCTLFRGEETDIVWHKYKKYYKSYSIVEPDDFCNYGELKELGK